MTRGGGPGVGLFDVGKGGAGRYGRWSEEDPADKIAGEAPSYWEPGRGGGRGLEDVEASVLGFAAGCLAAPGGGFAYNGGSREKCSCMMSSNSLKLHPSLLRSHASM